MGAGVLLAVLTAMCWSILDALRKTLGRRMSAIAAAGAMSLGGALPFLILVGAAPPQGAPPWSFWGYLAASAALNIVANVLFVHALQRSPLALTIPYLSFSPVFILLGGAVFLRQYPSMASLAGVILVVAGAIGLNPRVDGTRFNPLAALRRERGSLYMLLVALLWSAAAISDRRGVQLGGIALYSMGVNAAIGLPLLSVVTLRHPGEWDRIRREWRLLAAIVIAMSLAMFTQYRSWDFLFVAYTDAIKRAGGMLFSTLLGYFVFGERQVWQRLPAVAVMGAGVAIILLGDGR